MIGQANVCGITVIAENITESIAESTVMATCSNNSSYVSVSIRYMSLLHTVLILLFIS